MENGQKTLIDAAIAEGVPRYIAGDWSLDFRKLKYGEHPAKDPMKRVAEYLDEKKDQIKGVHVLNGEFLDIFWGMSGVYDANTTTFKYFGDGSEKLDLTTYNDAAHFTAEVALDKDAVGWLEGKRSLWSCRDSR